MQLHYGHELSEPLVPDKNNGRPNNFYLPQLDNLVIFSLFVEKEGLCYPAQVTQPILSRITEQYFKIKFALH